MGSTKERARSVVGLLTSLGLAVPAATSAGCVTTENPAPPIDAPTDARNFPDVTAIWNDGWGYDTGMDAGNPDVPDTGTDAPTDDAPTDDAPADDDASADDDAGAAG